MFLLTILKMGFNMLKNSSAKTERAKMAELQKIENEKKYLTYLSGLCDGVPDCALVEDWVLFSFLWGHFSWRQGYVFITHCSGIVQEKQDAFSNSYWELLIRKWRLNNLCFFPSVRKRGASRGFAKVHCFDCRRKMSKLLIFEHSFFASARLRICT